MNLAQIHGGLFKVELPARRFHRPPGQQSQKADCNQGNSLCKDKSGDAASQGNYAKHEHFGTSGKILSKKCTNPRSSTNY
jgi:hypothetical protein